MIHTVATVLVVIKGPGGGTTVVTAPASMEFTHQLDQFLMLKVSTGGSGKASVIPSSLLR